jgi:hypothetical protein
MVANSRARILRAFLRHFPEVEPVAIGLTERTRGAWHVHSEVGRDVSKVVNLNRFRKQKAKQARSKQADGNRRLHGRTKAERARDALLKKKLESSVDQARLEHTPKLDDDSAPED